MSRTECENCATPDDDLVAVHRVYLVPESWDTPASEQVLEAVERWCVSCCSQYPFRPAAGQPPPAATSPTSAR